jgi:hypothetical protein
LPLVCVEGKNGDIFISYSSKDRPWVSVLAQELASNGWSVWWDRELLAGQDFAKQIAAKLASARCVIVAWSQRSVESPWVHDEAADAQRRGTLVPVSIDGSPPPLGFGRLHTLDLSGRQDPRGHPELPRLVASVGERLGVQPQARQVALTAEIQTLLSAQIDGCRARNLPFRAAHFFIALFQTNADYTRSCLRRVDPERTRQFENELTRFVVQQDQLEQGAAFSEFELAQHPILIAAANKAQAENAGAIDERHLLTSLLDSSSSTVSRLRDLLRTEGFDRLQSVVRSSRLGTATPWIGSGS